MTGTTPRAPGSVVEIANLAVIIDPTSTKQPALAKALTLATQFGAAATLLSFDAKQLRGLRLAKKSPWRNHLPNYSSLPSWLNHFAIPFRARGIHVTTQIMNGGSAEDSLLRWLRQSNVDFVLKNARQASPNHTPMTDIDRHLVKFCPLPLLLCKPRQWQDSPIVVAAVDPLHGSDPNALLDHEIMAHAAHVVNRLGGKLHVFHALFPAASATTEINDVPLLSNIDRTLTVDEQRRHWAINAFVRRYSVDMRHLHVKIGVPDTHLPRIAMDHNANIVVMGALARNKVTTPDIGSTAESVFESLPCDVLVIKSPLASRIMRSSSMTTHSTQVETLNAAEVARLLHAHKLLLIDVREPEEYASERIAGALLFPLSTFDPAALPDDEPRRVVFHCGSGKRSLAAAERRLAAGHLHAAHMGGGLAAWKAAGLPVIRRDSSD